MFERRVFFDGEFVTAQDVDQAANRYVLLALVVVVVAKGLSENK